MIEHADDDLHTHSHTNTDFVAPIKFATTTYLAAHTTALHAHPPLQCRRVRRTQIALTSHLFLGMPCKISCELFRALVHATATGARRQEGGEGQYSSIPPKLIDLLGNNTSVSVSSTSSSSSSAVLNAFPSGGERTELPCVGEESIGRTWRGYGGVSRAPVPTQCARPQRITTAVCVNRLWRIANASCSQIAGNGTFWWMRMVSVCIGDSLKCRNIFVMKPNAKLATRCVLFVR